MVTTNNDIWYEKYRPQNINDLVLPDNFKEKLREFISKPFHVLLVSKKAGTGKTSTVNALIKEGQFESLFINASLDNGIDILRSKIVQFASTESVNGKDKIVVLDEFDCMSNNAMAACRGLIEEFSSNCKFIGTANFASKIIDPIKSRFCIFDYDKLYETEAPTMAKGIYDRLNFILNNEKISFNDADVKKIISAYYPSFRNMVGALQRSSIKGNLIIEEDGINGDFNNILKAIEDNNYTDLLKFSYGVNNVDDFYSWMFEVANKRKVNPNLYVVLAKYHYQHAHARDYKLNMVACCVEIIANNLLKA